TALFRSTTVIRDDEAVDSMSHGQLRIPARYNALQYQLARPDLTEATHVVPRHVEWGKARHAGHVQAGEERLEPKLSHDLQGITLVAGGAIARIAPHRTLESFAVVCEIVDRQDKNRA